MKSAIRAAVWFGVFALAVNATQAQRGGGGFRGQAGEILCDALVLRGEAAEALTSAYQTISDRQREDMRSGNVDFRNMSDEERTEYMEKRQKETAEALKKEMADVLTEKQLAAIEPLVMKRVWMPDAELRALRSVDLSEEQHAKIQPMATDLAMKMVGGGGMFGARMDEQAREKAQQAYDEAKKDFMGKVSAMLSEEQNAAWKEKTAEVNEELEAMRERMRNFRRQQ